MTGTRMMTIAAPSFERRSGGRYCLYMSLQWQLRQSGRVIARGFGQTIDLSANGVLFHAGTHLPPGLQVELKVDWPVVGVHGEALELSTGGVILRSDSSTAALRTVRRILRPHRTGAGDGWLVSADQVNSAGAGPLENMVAPCRQQ